MQIPECLEQQTMTRGHAFFKRITSDCNLRTISMGRDQTTQHTLEALKQLKKG